MELDWSVEREGGASLVGFRVRNDGAVPRRVRIESRLDAPVLSPRRGGVAAAGWDAAGVTAVIGPGDEEAFGFAALAERAEPPVEVVDVESADASGTVEGAADGEDDSAVRAALRDLDDHRPPRRAVDGADESGGEPGDLDRDAEGVESTDEERSDRSSAAGDTTPGETGPAEVELAAGDALFAAAEARIELAERLTDADLATATEAVEEAGGLDAVEDLDERVAADVERLRAIRDRAAALAERAEASDVPVAALEALA
ncbi:DUF7857 domain-containing protein [Halorubrum tebenquichense]|uniref:DUF8080 domain-containing protein n=1 Tax=Halorubrum tebenquichense DSM 14210 TaxID=1227485 RepID=M0DTA1_9EURY|nr:hypothetical protein [Halorubrum tebenquichense]ELZ38741.1 hypothetical protein C472_06625 [Halorubrum tebenquichense DSM 14210]